MLDFADHPAHRARMEQMARSVRPEYLAPGATLVLRVQPDPQGPPGLLVVPDRLDRRVILVQQEQRARLAHRD